MAVEVVAAVIAEKLAALLIHKVTLLDELHDPIRFIEQALRDLQGFAQRCRRETGKRCKIKEWVMDARDVAFKAEDDVDIFIFKKAQQKREIGFGVLSVQTHVKIFCDLFNKREFRMLSILDLAHKFIKTMPKELGKLLHPRYLGLRKAEADVNPLCICSLRNLQTLDRKGTTKLLRCSISLVTISKFENI